MLLWSSDLNGLTTKDWVTLADYIFGTADTTSQFSPSPADASNHPCQRSPSSPVSLYGHLQLLTGFPGLELFMVTLSQSIVSYCIICSKYYCLLKIFYLTENFIIIFYNLDFRSIWNWLFYRRWLFLVYLMKTLLDLFKESVYNYVSTIVSFTVGFLLLNIWKNNSPLSLCVQTRVLRVPRSISNVIYFFVTVILIDLV